MASRSTSHTQRPPSSSSIHQPRSNYPTANTAPTNHALSRRHLGHNAPRKPPSGALPNVPRRHPRTGSLPPTYQDGASDPPFTEPEEDIIISRPTFLFGAQSQATAMPEKLLSPGRSEQGMSEPMALLMAHNAALQRADAASDPIADAAASLIVRETGEWGPCGGASAAMGAGLGAGQTGSEAAVEAFRRRMRERQAKVEGVEFEGEEVEVLKRALWDCLRRRVEGLEEDAWMFEVEAETRGEGT